MLDELMMGGLAGCFGRVEPRRQARRHVCGLISDLPQKNCCALPEQAGDATPDRMQRLLERAAWDAFDAIRQVRAFAVRYLGDPADAMLVIDESGQEKTGQHTAGVKRQYRGCAGRVANGINVVYASYAAACVPLRCLPVIIACRRSAPDRRPVTVINVFLGWTCVGWVAALALAGPGTGGLAPASLPGQGPRRGQAPCGSRAARQCQRPGGKREPRASRALRPPREAGPVARRRAGCITVRAARSAMARAGRPGSAS
jgi:DDE superfamily endonuclease/Superinfection immunity protein